MHKNTLALFKKSLSAASEEITNRNSNKKLTSLLKGVTVKIINAQLNVINYKPSTTATIKSHKIIRIKTLTEFIIFYEL